MNIERIVALIVAGGIITSLILPGRQTVGVIGATDKLFRGALGTAMGTARPA